MSYYYQEVTAEELAVSNALNAALKLLKVGCRTEWGHTLYQLEDLPFSLSNLPELFTKFRKDVEKDPQIRSSLPAPASLPPLPAEIAVAASPMENHGNLPSITDLGLAAPQSDPRGVLAYKGGETAGIDRVQEYIWNRDRLRIYKETRNGMLGADYSSKFSTWLALGCVSPRYIYAQVQKISGRADRE